MNTFLRKKLDAAKAWYQENEETADLIVFGATVAISTFAFYHAIKAFGLHKRAAVVLELIENDPHTITFVQQEVEALNRGGYVVFKIVDGLLHSQSYVPKT